MINDDKNTIDIEWSPSKMVEIELKDPSRFVMIMETLTRVGIASHRTDTLFQSCHILQKRGLYYIVHFKELFMLDDKRVEWTINDIIRRNAIIHLLSEWDLCTVVDKKQIEHKEDMHNIIVLRTDEKKDWKLVSKYTIGNI